MSWPSGGTKIVAVACLALAGCGTTPWKAPEVVKVPVAVACIKDSPAKPVLVTDAELKAMNDYQLPLALFRDREQRQVYEGTLETVIEMCK